MALFRKTLLFLAGAVAAAPAAAQIAPPAPVEQTSLARDAFATGVLARAEGALDSGLWKGAQPATLSRLLDAAPARPAGPSLGEAMRRILLSPGDAPDGAGPDLGGRKLLALARAGFIDEARTIASISSAPRGDPHVGEALATADLYSGDVQAACRRNAGLSSGRDETFWVKLRVICYAAAGERDAADLTYGLLRDRGLLDEADEILLNALVAGAAPKTPVAPENALHLAAVRALQLPLAPGLLEKADGGTLKAVARDETLEPATRIAAATRAAAMGAMSAGDLAALYGAVPADVADVAQAGARIATHPDDPMTDVLLYKSIAGMTAPEFMRDKAARIADALSIADSFPRAYAAALLYQNDLKALEGALVAPGEAMRFAEARMAVGDGDGAARWLGAAFGADGLSSLGEDQKMAFIGLADLLAALDPVAAKLLAERAGVALGASAPAGAVHARGGEADAQLFAAVVDAAFDAALRDIPGQAGLAALAASSAAPEGDPVGDVVIGQSLRAAGLSDLRRRMQFEAAWKARFSETQPASAGPGEAAAAGAGASSGDGGLLPRLKPRSRP